MFGRVYSWVLLTAVILTAVIERREIIEYSPWCSCKVSAQLTIMIPRPFPCKRPSKHANKRLYLVLLILLAGDVELNPGPTGVGINDSDSQARLEEDAREAKCLVCDKASDSLTLRSRTVADTVRKCSAADCNKFVHHRCEEQRKNGDETEWACASHSQRCHNHQPECQRSSSQSDDNGSSGTSARGPRRHTEPEAVQGPSFLSISMMDLMEALRLTQLKMDKVAEDLEQLKEAFQSLASQDGRDRGSTYASPRDVSVPPQDGGSSGVSRRNDTNRTIAGVEGSNFQRKPDLLIIGDSNVRRLADNSDGQTNTVFRSIPGATVDELKRDITKRPGGAVSSKVVLHIGTNDLARRGSEETAKSIVDLAQHIRIHSKVDKVFVCSVTSRKDLGSFIYSRAESVNNRLCSLCVDKPGITFIDLRRQLDRCKFSGLAKDALHYNRVGAARVLSTIKNSANSFLTHE